MSTDLPWRFQPVDDGDDDVYYRNVGKQHHTAQTPHRDSKKRAFDIDQDDINKSIPYEQVIEKRRRQIEVEAALNALLGEKPDIFSAQTSVDNAGDSNAAAETRRKRKLRDAGTDDERNNNSKKTKAAGDNKSQPKADDATVTVDDDNDNNNNDSNSKKTKAAKSKKRAADDATDFESDIDEIDRDDVRHIKKVPILTDKDGFAIPLPRAKRALHRPPPPSSSSSSSSTEKSERLQRDEDSAAAERVKSRLGSRLRQPNRLSHDAFFRHQVRSDAEEQGDRMRRERIHEKWEHSSMNKTSQAECVGDRRMRMMKEALEFLGKNGFDWSKAQRVMHMAWLACSNGQYYGDELKQHLVRLLREQGWSEQRSECVVLAPRRNGKTIAVSGFAAAEIVTQPGTPGSERGHDVLVYSNNMRASKMLLLQTYKMVKILQQKFGGYVKSLNKNESMVFITAEGYENEMCAYPAKPENLRGTGSKAPTGTVIAEEFAYMPLEVVFSIIGPTLTRKNVKFIGITTVSGQDSFVTPLVDAKYPDGRSVMLTLNFELVCADCKKAGKAHLCKCLMGDIPPWQSSVQHGKLSILMEQHMETYMKELKGFAIDETISPAFCQISVDFLNTPEAIMPTSDLYAERVYTVVDPACGGRYSKYAIVSVIWIDGKMVVAGADSCTSNRPEEQKAKLVEHIRKVRSIRGLETAKIIFAPESNLGLEGKRIAADLALAQVPECYCLIEDTKGGEGIRMTNELKKEMWLSFNALLLNRQIRWHPNMVSLSDDEGYSPEGMRKMITGELSNYKRMLVYSKTDPYADPKEVFTGKVGGAKDDHCIAIQLAFKSMEFWHANADFYKHHKALWTPSHD